MTINPSKSPKPTLHVVATSHLDTQWRWTFQQTVHRYLSITLRDNFALFEKYPNYTFSFEGAFRYMMAKDYFPTEFEKLKEYVAAGRWVPCGASVDAGDVNTVSPESLVRQTLYGNGFFRREFGVTSLDIFLPDCFGFGWSLPSVAAHCGLRGFSTSKLEWGSSVGIPFSIGFWEGVDGNGLLAQINPGQYSFPIKEEDLAHHAPWVERANLVGDQCGHAVEFKYFGLGDTGGAPAEESVAKLEAAIADTAAPLRVLSSGADTLARALPDEAISRLPRHRGEFLLIEHGAGTYTAHGHMKWLNRANENAAFVAEALSCFAEWAGGSVYPQAALERAWIRVLANQMHDILPGTSIPEAYEFSWRDEYTSLVEFREIARHAATESARALAPALGMEWVLFNPVSHARAGIVELDLPEPRDGAYAVTRSDGEVLLSQYSTHKGKLLVVAELPALGISRIGVTLTKSPVARNIGIRIDKYHIESDRLICEINENGDLSRVYDKVIGRELLEEPVVLQFLRTAPREWPAWTIIHDDLMAEPKAVLCSPESIEILESGPVRATLRITRRHAESLISMDICLSAAPADRVDMHFDIDWATKGTLLKAAFPLSPAPVEAKYDLGLGVIERGVNHPRLHEVPAQEWAALHQDDLAVAVLSDCKYGWDRPTGNTLRLTLLQTPEMTGFQCYLSGVEYLDHFLDQEYLDFGRHQMGVAITASAGSWNSAWASRAGMEFSRPIQAWRLPEQLPGAGPAMRQLARIDSDAVAVMALKKAENGKGAVLRVRNLLGTSQDRLSVSLFDGLVKADQLNGMEDTLSPMSIQDGLAEYSVGGWSLATLGLQPLGCAAPLTKRRQSSVELVYTMRGVSTRENPCDGDLDGQGHTLPHEILGSFVESRGVRFQLGPVGYRALNVMACQGQELVLPDGSWSELHLLGCGVSGAASGNIEIGGKSHPLNFAAFDWHAGRWFSRCRDGVVVGKRSKLLEPHFDPQPVAWGAPYRHSKAAHAVEACVPCFLFHQVVPLSDGDLRVVFPREHRMRILAATAVGAL